MDMLNPQDWSFPVPIIYGPGRLKEIASLCNDAGTRNPLLVTDCGSRDLPFIAEIIDIDKPMPGKRSRNSDCN